jgi:hypothetical protein
MIGGRTPDTGVESQIFYRAQPQASHSQTSQEQVWPSQSGHLQSTQPQSVWADLAAVRAQQAGGVDASAAALQPQPVHSQVSQLQVVPSQSGQRQTSQPQLAALDVGAACVWTASAYVKTSAATSSASNEKRFIEKSPLSW